MQIPEDLSMAPKSHLNPNFKTHNFDAFSLLDEEDSPNSRANIQIIKNYINKRNNN